MNNPRTIIAGGAITLAAGAIAVVAMMLGQPAPPAAAPAPTAVATAEVTRGDLRDTKTVSGTLGFGDPVTLRPRVGSAGGVVTWLAPEGHIVERGEPLLALDGSPVVLWYGTSPLHRTLRFEADKVVWVELETAQQAVASAVLKLELERARLDEAQSRLADAGARLADSSATPPRTAEFIDLAAKLHAADERLQRVRELSAADYSSSAELDKAEAELAAARAAVDAATRAIRQQQEAARLDVAAARVAVAAAEEALELAEETLAALDAQAETTADIDLVADNLAGLGFEGKLAGQVRAWQAAVGLPVTGRIEPQSIVVAERAIRIDAHRTAVGNGIFEASPELSAALDYTPTEKLATVPLDIADRGLAAIGGKVTITLPDDSTVEGTVTTVGTVITDGAVEVEIAIADQAALSGVEVASVEVEFVSATREDVLSVPVAALLALPDRGFGVELVEGDRARLVPVEVGMFASGRVELTGEGIAEGARVSVPG